MLKSAASTSPSREGLQPGVQRGEVAVGDDVGREEAAGMDAAELLKLDAARQQRAALALGVVAVAGRAAETVGGERPLAGGRRSRPAGERELELGGPRA